MCGLSRVISWVSLATRSTNTKRLKNARRSTNDLCFVVSLREDLVRSHVEEIHDGEDGDDQQLVEASVLGRVVRRLGDA
jgi:hypothetical protein